MLIYFYNWTLFFIYFIFFCQWKGLSGSHFAALLGKQGLFVRSCTESHGRKHISDCLLSHYLQHQISSNIRNWNCTFQSKKQLKYKLVPLLHFKLILYYCLILYPPCLILQQILPFKQNKVVSSLLTDKCLNWKHSRHPAPEDKLTLWSCNNCQKHWASCPHPHHLCLTLPADSLAQPRTSQISATIKIITATTLLQMWLS